MSKIVPAVLETTKEKFLDTMSKEIRLPGVERIQVDFADGIFVPNTTLPVSDIDTLNPAFEWEAHLMVKEPADFLDYKISGFNTLLIHYEAFESKEAVANAIAAIQHLELKPGLVINPETSVSVLKDFEGLINHFQIMSIHPGYQGTPFLEESINRIKELRGLIPNAIIEVDGGVKLENIHAIAKAGADLIITGSSLVKAPDMLAAYDQLFAEMTKQ